MDSNYREDEHGVVHQVQVEKFDYTPEYVKAVTEVIPDKGRGTAVLRMSILAEMVPAGSKILDVGYGNGVFLDVCKGAGFETCGFDISGFPINHRLLPSMVAVLQEKFDVVTFFDSLEHIPDLSFLKVLQTEFVVVSVPWYHPEKGFKWFKSWKHRKPNEHLHHFSNLSIVPFFKSMGYKTIYLDNCEDVLRRSVDGSENILTGVFKKA